MPMHIYKTVCVLCGMLLLMPAAADDLITVYRQALKSDPTFRAADAAYLAALETRPQSLAVLLPDLSATGSLSRERFDPRNTGPTTYATNQTYALGLRQPVFRRDRFIQLEQADSRVAQADAEYVAARQDLIIRVATAYFVLLGAQDNLAFVRADKLALTRTLDQAQQRFEVGLAAITDSLKAQAAYDIAVSDEISAEQLLADAREALRELTGTLPEQPEILQPDIPLLAPEPASDEKWVAAAGEQNPLVLAARAAATTAREEVRVQQSGHYPTLDLTANYAYRDSSFGGIAQQERNDSRVGLELNLPIYQGGLVTSQTRQSRYLYNQAMEEQAKQQRAVERQTRDDYRGVISGISRVNALQRAIQSNEKAYE
ncbi:MAG: TolC family outer membrane protein, partial [Gammaproteobacteria bacterium]|nr:TolC family outer membrane protein [Gammaproteobacteria bacterium]